MELHFNHSPLRILPVLFDSVTLILLLLLTILFIRDSGSRGQSKRNRLDFFELRDLLGVDIAQIPLEVLD